jgi:hypothetical protein
MPRIIPQRTRLQVALPPLSPKDDRRAKRIDKDIAAEITGDQEVP